MTSSPRFLAAGIQRAKAVACLLPLLAPSTPVPPAAPAAFDSPASRISPHCGDRSNHTWIRPFARTSPDGRWTLFVTPDDPLGVGGATYRYEPRGGMPSEFHLKDLCMRDAMLDNSGRAIGYSYYVREIFPFANELRVTELRPGGEAKIRSRLQRRLSTFHLPTVREILRTDTQLLVRLFMPEGAAVEKWLFVGLGDEAGEKLVTPQVPPFEGLIGRPRVLGVAPLGNGDWMASLWRTTRKGGPVFVAVSSLNEPAVWHGRLDRLNEAGAQADSGHLGLGEEWSLMAGSPNTVRVFEPGGPWALVSVDFSAVGEPVVRIER